MAQEEDYLTLKVAQVVNLPKELRFMITSRNRNSQEISYNGICIGLQGNNIDTSTCTRQGNSSDGVLQLCYGEELSLGERVSQRHCQQPIKQFFQPHFIYRHLQQLVFQSLRQSPFFNGLQSKEGPRVVDAGPGIDKTFNQ